MKTNKMKIKTEKFWLGKNNSYEVRIYCDLCNEEVAELDQEEHECEVEE